MAYEEGSLRIRHESSGGDGVAEEYGCGTTQSASSDAGFGVIIGVRGGEAYGDGVAEGRVGED